MENAPHCSKSEAFSKSATSVRHAARLLEENALSKWACVFEDCDLGPLFAGKHPCTTFTFAPLDNFHPEILKLMKQCIVQYISSEELPPLQKKNVNREILVSSIRQELLNA